MNIVLNFLIKNKSRCLSRDRPRFVGDLTSKKDSPKGFYLRTLPSTCLDFSSQEGKILFGEALARGNMESYFRLAGQYHAQSEPAFCGIAVLCMILNSLSIDPQRIWKSPWRWYSEEMMGCCVPLDEIKKQGIDFDVFASMASCKGAQVEAFRSDLRTEEQFRADIQRATSSNTEFIVASYDRRSIGQTGSGHFCPIAGYHEPTDKVLLMDAARFKYPPHWVSISLIYAAMVPIDPKTDKPRGYFKIGKSPDTILPLVCKTTLKPFEYALPEANN